MHCCSKGKKHTLTLADRALGGGQVLWYKDGGVDNSSILGYSDDSPRYTASDSAPLNPISEYGDPIALKAILSDGAKSAAMSASSLIIQGNEAPRGGGIGTNGGIILGDEQEYDYTLQVKKTWTDAEDNLKVPVTVYLKLGDHVLDPVELNEENGWTAAFTGLPDPKTLGSLFYAVAETPVPSGFIPSYTPADIDEDSRTISITVNNKYAPTGGLTVSKTVAGNAGNQAADFHFTVKLSDTSISGTYGDMTFVDGVAEFTLKHGEQKTASSLPVGVQYTVTENEANQDGYSTAVSGDTGTIEKDVTQSAAFTNTKNSGGGGGGSKKSYGKLTVSKTVAGSAGETDRKFTFTIKLDRSLTGKYGDMTFDKGVAVISLKHGESSTATDLPSGITYTVTESDNDGYTVTAVGDTGTIRSNQTATAAFTNTKDTTPPDNPDTPTSPDQPDNPDQPNNPDTLVTPESPSNPDKSSTPEQPTSPSKPDKTSSSGTPDQTPRTNDTAHLTLWFILTAISAAGLVTSLIFAKKYRYRGKRIKR